MMGQTAGTAHQQKKFFPERVTFANREFFSANGKKMRQI